MAVSLAPPFFSYLPNPNNTGGPAAGFKLFFYAAGSSTKQNVWSDATQTVVLSNPVILDSQGGAVVWGDPSIPYKLVFAPATDTDPPTSPIRTVDNWYFPLTAGSTSAVFGVAPTAAETAAGVTVTATQYQPGNLLRYGIVPNSIAAAASNTIILTKLLNPSVAGPTGEIFSPNTTGTDIYNFSDFIQIRDGVDLNLGGTTWSVTKTGVAGDVNNGFLFALRRVRIRDGKISVNYNNVLGLGACGQAIVFGGRDVPVAGSPLPTIFDSLLSEPMNDLEVRNIKIAMSLPGTTNPSTSCILMYGGLRNVIFENVEMDGGSACYAGIEYEFGWATNTSPNSTRQTSHMHNAKFKNVSITNIGSPSGAVGGISLGGAYNVEIDNLYVNNSPVMVNSYVGEASFYRPWTSVDDIGAKHNLLIKNAVGGSITGSSGINCVGAQKPSANGGYLWKQWLANTAYVVNQTAYNGGNVYVCTVAGTSAGSGGPGGTGTGITDGGVTWNYIPLTAWTDLMDLTLENIRMDGTSTGFGVSTSASRLLFRGGYLTNFQRGVVTTDECTFYAVDGVTILNCSSFGMQIGQAVDVYGTARQSIGSIRNGFIAGSNNSAAIVAANTLAMTIEGMRFGYEAIHDGIAETVQTNAVNLSASCLQVKIRNCYVATPSGGAVAFAQVGASSSNGNSFDSIYGTTTFSGFWDNHLAGCSADRGDNNVTLTPGADFQVQIFNTPLTASRTVTLGTGGNGTSDSLKWRIVRTAASTGAFGLNVGGLKSTPNSTAVFVDVQWDTATAAYILTGYGTL